MVSSRRTDPETHGAARLLICWLCGTEWPFLRVRCRDLWAIEQGYERIEPGWAGI